MKLNVTELNKGIEAEFVKQAAPLPTTMYNGAAAIPRAAAGAASAGAKSLAPAVAKGAGGFVAKKLPVIGGVVHGGMALNDARNGDWTGAALNAGAGIAGLIPHPAATAAMWGLDAANAGRSIGSGVSNMVGEAAGTVGKYAPLAMAGLAALSRGGNRPPQQMMYNPYGPKPRSILDTTQMDPHSLAAPQMFAEKLAAYLQKKAGIADAVAGAASRKVLDSVFDSSAHPMVDPVLQQQKEKELELTSKYPEIEQMLKNEQNKAYLEKLLKA